MDFDGLEKMRDFRRDGFRLEMFYTGRTDRDGRDIIAYRFHHGGRIVFEGADFKSSPLDSIDGDRSAASLLAFLSLRPGDTDREYFDSYSPEQMDFAIHHGEELSIIAMELEERDGDADDIAEELEAAEGN